MKKTKAEYLEMEKAMTDSMTLLLGHNSLHNVLKALSKGCMARCREMLNANTPKDTSGNTLRALLDFSERIDRLSGSAQSHNPDAPKQVRAWSGVKHEKAYGKPISRKISEESYED